MTPPGIELANMDRVRVLTLQRPEKLNAVTREMHRYLAGVWWELGRGTGPVIITGAGKAFSAGGDTSIIDDMEAAGEAPEGMIAEEREIVVGMLSLPVPIISAVNGLAVGFGASLVALSDFVVMEEQSYLRDPHVQLGMPPAPGCALVWPHLAPLGVAKEWLALGTKISAGDAERHGLANKVVAPGKALDEALAWAGQLADRPAEALGRLKRTLNAPLLAAFASGDYL